jgi:23S rRNA pseudouridine1911/1915/1917 synthase
MSFAQKDIIFELQKAAPPCRLDKVVHEQCTKLAPFQKCTRSQIKLWIERGSVSVNGAVVTKAGYEVRPGDAVRVVPPEPEPATLVPYEHPLTILHEDDGLVVIDKPAGLAMHPGAGNKSKTLVNALYGKLRHFEGKEQWRPGVVHRLDKDTSGVVVVAKTVEVHADLVRQFAARTIERMYCALLFCAPRALHPVARKDEGTIDASIARHPRKRKQFVVVAEGGRRAVSHWKVIERMPFAALTQIHLETGRTHQIRVHMEHLGAPIVGDKTYGRFGGLAPALARAADLFGRQALHAQVLGFVHPLSGKKLRFESKLPADMQKLIELFRSFK